MLKSNKTQSEISIGRDGDVVGGNKYVKNEFINNNYRTRLSRLFEALIAEVNDETKLEDVCEELNRYLVDKDIIGLEQKLTDGGFSQNFISDASEQKEMFAKKMYKFRNYESAQFIYVELLAVIKTTFLDLIFPLIEEEVSKKEILQSVREKIIEPINERLNKEGAEDTILNLNSEEIRGMVYYLTGRCHIKWNYDNI
ncbi:ABC-three component system protein [uncultured Tenacibaculum sp.]|uniref:ABC-three component system protein n=1 Tax=uncultured Tenacibaculum sp. TaxID=174713 RepID=UPI002622168C|nr:ABC-three component system protein [uncultured Tenacibaculum sp.]